MQGLCRISARLLGPREGKGGAANFFGPLCWGPPGMQGLCTFSALFWAPKKVGIRQPILILSPFLGTPEIAGVM